MATLLNFIGIMLRMFSSFFLFTLLLMPLVHAASLNLNGARHGLKRQELFDIIKQKNIDVTFVQETL